MVAGWSGFYGHVGVAVEVATDRVLVRFPGEAKALRFGPSEVVRC